MENHWCIGNLILRSPERVELKTEADIETQWEKRWINPGVRNAELTDDPTQKSPRYGLTRTLWTAAMNRLRTEQDRCNYELHK